MVADILKRILEEGGDMEVVGVARDGLEAITVTETLKPDLITMDIVMPNLDGVEATRVIMEQNPTPIVIISGELDEEVYSTFKALEAGALAVIAKPKNIESNGFQKVRNYMLDTIRSMATVEVHRHLAQEDRKIKKIKVIEREYNHQYGLLALGSSTGGPSTLKAILSALPASFELPIVVVQHIGLGFDAGFAYWLNQFTDLNVKIAVDNERLLPGTVYISPNEIHMTIRKTRADGKYVVDLQDTEAFEGFKPSVDVLFNSLAALGDKNIIAGLLTGMGIDGAKGLLNLKKNNCCTFAQDEETSVIYGMPKMAMKLNAANEAIPLNQIPAYLISQVSEASNERK